ncbi:hypothetical protein QQ045_005704 [Rhodiola kirilowii]
MFQLTLSMVAQDPQDLLTPIFEQGHLPATPAHCNAFDPNALLELLQQFTQGLRGLPPPRPTYHYILVPEARPMEMLSLARNPQPSLFALPGQSRPRFSLSRAVRHLFEGMVNLAPRFQRTMARISSHFHYPGLPKNVAELQQDYQISTSRSRFPLKGEVMLHTELTWQTQEEGTREVRRGRNHPNGTQKIFIHLRSLHGVRRKE